MSYRLGIDVGGTFTDFLCLGGGAPLVHKTSSTTHDPSLAFVRGLEEIAGRLDLAFEDFVAQIELIVHGTTVSTNAVLTGNGSKTGALLTEGFRDTLRLRDGTRATPYDNHLVPPPPLAPREHTHGVTERIGPEGQVLTELDESSVRAAAEALAAAGVEAVAISFMHSPQNAAHERRAREIVAEVMPDAYLTASSDLLEQIRYYPRTSTTVLNAYVGPIISGYMEGLTARLAELRFAGVLLIMQSNGGVATPQEISRRAALSLLSGPASGPTAGLHHLADAEVDACLTVDMGGTSFDVAMVVDGRPVTMTDGVVADWPLALPTIDIHTIGAGGGSDRRGRRGRPALGRPAQRRRRTGPRLLRARRHRADDHRRRPDPRLPLGDQPAGGRRAARPRGGAERLPAGRRRPRRLDRGGGGRRLRPDQRQHGDRGARHHRAPRPRPARLPGRRRRRRRAAARRGDRRRARGRAAARPARVLDLLRRRDADVRLPARRGAGAEGAARRARPGRGGEDPGRARRRRPRDPARRGRRRRGDLLHRLARPPLRRPVARARGGAALGAGRGARPRGDDRRASTPSTTAPSATPRPATRSSAWPCG